LTERELHLRLIVGAFHDLLHKTIDSAYESTRERLESQARLRLLDKPSTPPYLSIGQGAVPCRRSR
jgi:hypothetical protein